MAAPMNFYITEFNINLDCSPEEEKKFIDIIKGYKNPPISYDDIANDATILYSSIYGPDFENLPKSDRANLLREKLLFRKYAKRVLTSRLHQQ
jgi:hypothetical protein